MIKMAKIKKSLPSCCDTSFWIIFWLKIPLIDHWSSIGGSKGVQETPPGVQILSIWKKMAKSYVGAIQEDWRS